MEEKIEELKINIKEVTDLKALMDLKTKYLGKRIIPEIALSMKDLSKEEKKRTRNIFK